MVIVVRCVERQFSDVVVAVDAVRASVSNWCR